MEQVDFIYNGDNIKIICNLNEKMNEILNKFLLKVQIEKNSVIFLYEGKKIDEELSLEEIKGDKKDIKILVCKIEEIEKRKNVIIKSKNVICPECGEDIRIKIENYKIRLYGCKNGHEIKDIIIEEYENIQGIDISKIKCNKCENNKSNTYNNEFYRCIKCKINICPICKSKHDKNHNIINYENKNYICENHNEVLMKYCNDCKKNICISCSNEHKSHKTIYYDNILPDIEKIREEMKELKEEIEIFNKNIKNIIRKLNKVKENMEIYYKINEDIINNEIENRNYKILQNY